jgi:hypothetical protein
MEFKKGMRVHQKNRFLLATQSCIRMYYPLPLHTLTNKKSLLIIKSLLKKVDTFDIKVDYFGKK